MVFSVFFHSKSEFGDFPATFDDTAALDTEQLLLREGLQGPGPAREDHRRLRHGDGVGIPLEIWDSMGGFPNGSHLVKDNYIDITSISFSAFFLKWLALLYHMNKLIIWGFITFWSWLSRLGVARFWAKHAKPLNVSISSCQIYTNVLDSCHEIWALSTI